MIKMYWLQDKKKRQQKLSFDFGPHIRKFLHRRDSPLLLWLASGKIVKHQGKHQGLRLRNHGIYRIS